MNKSAKTAFWKFFLIYFLSVALLIVAAGFFYYKEQFNTLLAKEQFSLIWYARMLKMTDFRYEKEGYSYSLLKNYPGEFDPKNLKIDECCIQKIVPNRKAEGFILVKKSVEGFKESINSLKNMVFLVEAILLAIFGAISFFLARSSIKGLQENIERLDLFIKDLIHDINTPSTSILLNVKLLKRYKECKERRELARIEKSAKELGRLYENLNVLLQRDALKKELIDPCKILAEILEIVEGRYGGERVKTECEGFLIESQPGALRQILLNLLDNAFKHGDLGAKVKIWSRDRKIFIKNEGAVIENPSKIFDLHYTESAKGSGIGLHITKTLCDALGIKIEVESKKNFGTVFSLDFN